MIKELKLIICEEEAVRGAYDITLFDYGPNKHYGSAHIELPDTMNVDAVDRITRTIQANVFQKTGVILTGIGVYSFNTSDDEAAQSRSESGHVPRLGTADARILCRSGKEDDPF